LKLENKKEIYNKPFKDMIKEYPQLGEIFRKYGLDCGTCQFANNFTLGELIPDKKGIKEKIKADIFRLIKQEGVDLINCRI
jgi:hypothetical protein